MNVLMAIVVGVLFAAGTYLILRPNLIRMVMGFAIYSNAANLLLITSGGYAKTKVAPFVGEGQVNADAFMDPLPPDIILTAIVISFAVSALLLTVCYRVYLDHGTDNPEELPLHDDPEHDAVASTPQVPDVFDQITNGSGTADAQHGSNSTSTRAVESGM